MLNPLRVAIQITRPHNMLAAALSVAAGYYIAGGREWGVVAWPLAITALITGAGNIINDYFDVDIDRINKPRRPLPSGQIGLRAAMALYVAMTVVATTAAVLWTRPAFVLIAAAWQLCLVAYAWRVKAVLGLGNLLVAAVTSSAFLAGAIVAGRPPSASVPVAIAFAFVFCRELVKGAEDVEGDGNAGVSTFAVALGMGKTVVMTAVLMLLVALLLPLPAIVGHYGRYYFWTMELLVVPLLVAGAILIVRRPQKRVFARVSLMLKLGMFFGIVALALGNH